MSAPGTRPIPLRSFRERFALPAGVIYLDGNSLGPLPKATRARLAEAVDRQWGEGLIRGWNEADWIGAPARVGAKIARLIGAAPHEVTVADSTSVNLYKLLAAALERQSAADPARRVILTEAGNLPTDLYVAQGLAAFLPNAEVRAAPREAVEAAIGPDVAVVMLTEVHYKTAARWDMAALTRRAHEAGALALWDLSHSAGALEVDLRGCGADLAVGCGYKFLNGGPGAPAFLFVAEAPAGSAGHSPLTGWMGHAAAFDFTDAWRPAPGVARFLCGTPPVLGLAALEAGVDLALAADIAQVEAKSARLWDLFAARMDARCGGFGFRRLTPPDPAARGSHISYARDDGYRIVQALIARGVIGDFRDPDVLRFGLTPLYLGFEDIWRAVEVLAEIMESAGAPGGTCRSASRGG